MGSEAFLAVVIAPRRCALSGDRGLCKSSSAASGDVETKTIHSGFCLRYGRGVNIRGQVDLLQDLAVVPGVGIA